MTGTLTKGALLGGLTLFVWGALSWMVLPWHMKTMNTFTDEKAVALALVGAAPASGVYMLPNGHPNDPNLTPEQRSAAMAQAKDRMTKGPIALVVVNLTGMDPDKMGPMLAKGFVVQALAALLFTWLLLQAGIAGYGARVLFVVVAALAGAVVCHLPNMVWMGYPADYTNVLMADTVVGWLLGGLVLAKITAPRRAAAPAAKGRRRR